MVFFLATGSFLEYMCWSYLLCQGGLYRLLEFSFRAALFSMTPSSVNSSCLSFPRLSGPGGLCVEPFLVPQVEISLDSLLDVQKFHLICFLCLRNYCPSLLESNVFVTILSQSLSMWGDVIPFDTSGSPILLLLI